MPEAKTPERNEGFMTKIGLIRCERNADKCPLTGCLTCIRETRQGFNGYDEAELVGMFTCTCPGDDLAEYARVLRKKGAEAIHLSTCAFSHKGEGQWIMGDGLCVEPDSVMKKLSGAVDIPCVMGTAHLPPGYRPEVY
jgi:predicted metal-binding protein